MNEMFRNSLWKVFFDDGAAGGGAGGGQGNNGQQSAGSNQQSQGDLTFESWFEKQDDKTKGLLDGHTKSLKSALESERASRKDLEKQVRDLALKAEKGSTAETQLTALADKIAEGDRKAEFFDAAHKAGVTNLKLAYTVAVTDDLFDKKGIVDFGKLKTSYPELFGAKKTPNGNAGDGTELNTNAATDMNARIRRAAGRVPQ